MTLALHGSSFVRGISQILRPSPNGFDFANLNQSVVKAEHAVRGAITQRSASIRKRMKAGEKFPFSSVISCNIGNPFAVGKPEITFARQLVAACECEEIRNTKIFPPEVVERANQILASTPGGLGAYTDSQGIEIVRKHVAEFIEKRDGFPSDPDKIYLTNGASQAVEFLVKLIVSNPNVGVLLPYPTYSLYTAELDMVEGKHMPYYLDEERNWDTPMEELERAYAEAKDQGVDVRALVVINPNNPTGHTISRSMIEQMVDFAETHKMLIIADEVYQANIYDGSHPFVSFKEVVMKKRSKVQLASLHSISKGYIGECGHRGGYLELHNIPQESCDQILKLASLSLSSNGSGQVIIDCMVKPPESSECKKLWDQQTTAEIKNLGQKAKQLQEALNKLPGIHCQPSNGAMYLFPSLTYQRRRSKLQRTS